MHTTPSHPTTPFGELRSILEGAPSLARWGELCAWLDTLEGGPEFEVVVLPYCRQGLARQHTAWCRVARRAPARWFAVLLADEDGTLRAVVPDADTSAPELRRLHTFAQLAAWWGHPDATLASEEDALRVMRSFERVLDHHTARESCARITHLQLLAQITPDTSGDAAVKEDAALLRHLDAVSDLAQGAHIAPVLAGWRDMERARASFLAVWLFAPSPEARARMPLLSDLWARVIELLTAHPSSRASLVLYPGAPDVGLLWIAGDEAHYLHVTRIAR